MNGFTHPTGPDTAVAFGPFRNPAPPQASSIVDTHLPGTIRSVAANGSDTTTPISLSPTDGDKTAPDVSPDGARIVYAGKDPTHPRSGIYVANQDGSDARRLNLGSAIADAYRPRFSPDGTHIVFSATDAGTADTAPRRVWSISPDGSNLHRIRSDDASYETAQPSPDSQGIVATRLGSTSGTAAGTSIRVAGAPQAWVMKADGTDAQQLVATPARDASYGPRARRRPTNVIVTPEFVRRYAPYIGQDRNDGFYPVRFNWVSLLRDGNGHETCLKAWNGACVPSGRRILPLTPDTGQGMSLDYPANDVRNKQEALIESTLARNHVARGPINRQTRVPAAYYYVGYGRNSFVIQYWYFWTFNYFVLKHLPDQDRHEGDLEHVDITFDAQGHPQLVTLSRHSPQDYGTMRWSAAPRQSGTRHVYVHSAHGDHGFYPACGKFKLDPARGKAIIGLLPEPIRRKLSPSDITCAAGNDQVVTQPTTLMMNLASLTLDWSCWGGKLGSAGPAAPLIQSVAPLARPMCEQTARHMHE
jgi:hypothetical protein